jgi:hypothetical protein
MNWTEFHIGLVYFSGLAAALLSGVIALLYLRPISGVIKKITRKNEILWIRYFRLTVIFAAMTGALSVSFRTCGGSYDYLLDSRKETLMKGAQQVYTSFYYLLFVFGLWLIIFLVMRRRVKN